MTELDEHTLRPRRVVHVTSAHDACDVRIFYKECRSLARTGYEVIELANEPLNTELDGVRIRGLGKCRSRIHRVTTKMIAIAREAFRLKADVYHIHDPELLPLALLLRASGRCVIYDIHEDLPRTILYKDYIPSLVRTPMVHMVEWLENAFAGRMSGLVVATPTIANRFRSFHPNVAVVGNFPILGELAHASQVEWSKRRRSAAYIGGIAEERGIRQLLAATERLADVDAKLELAGWFSDPALAEEVMQSPGWSHVTWYGLLNRARIAELLGSVRAGLAVLLPEENFVASQPTKLFEYMAAGLPVIASDFPLWRSIIARASCGILVDPHDSLSVAKAISYLVTHDAEAEAMGQRGRAAAEQHYNWDSEESTLISFYADRLCLGRDKLPAVNQHAGS